MPGSKKRSSPDKAWRVFERRHRGNPFLAQDPLYSLTEDVIDAIKQHVPGFFTPQQEQFERDLARMTGGGFFLRRPLGEPTALIHKPGLTIGEFLRLPPRHHSSTEEPEKRLAPVLKPEWFVGEHVQDAISAIQEFIGDVWKAGGRADEDIQAAFGEQHAEQGVLVKQGEAYAGWLVLNKRFRRELRYFQKRWSKVIARRGGFPRLTPPTANATMCRVTPKRDACTWALIGFYHRWCLDRMLTWDLPAPRDARLHFKASETPDLSPDEGITLQVPWYLLRGGRFDLQEVMKRIRFESAPEHLREWVCKESEHDHQAGGISYQRLHWLYRCYELVLFRRYGSICKTNIENLDRAMGQVMGRDEDLVKRLRQRLAREMKA